MPATRQDISDWFDEGVKRGATHMVVCCDTWDYSDFPRFVKPGDDVHAAARPHNDMERIMEVYALHLPKQEQMDEHRAFHYDNPP